MPLAGLGFLAALGHAACLTPLSLSSLHAHPHYHALLHPSSSRGPDRLCAGSCLETDDVLGRNGKVY